MGLFSKKKASNVESDKKSKSGAIKKIKSKGKGVVKFVKKRKISIMYAVVGTFSQLPWFLYHDLPNIFGTKVEEIERVIDTTGLSGYLFPTLMAIMFVLGIGGMFTCWYLNKNNINQNQNQNNNQKSTNLKPKKAKNLKVSRKSKISRKKSRKSMKQSSIEDSQSEM